MLRTATARDGAVLRGHNDAPARDDHQESRVRLLLLSKGAVLAHACERPLAAELDDEEQRARHGSAVAAAGRRASSSLANVALLRLPQGSSAVIHGGNAGRDAGTRPGCREPGVDVELAGSPQARATSEGR